MSVFENVIVKKTTVKFRFNCQHVKHEPIEIVMAQKDFILCKKENDPEQNLKVKRFFCIASKLMEKLMYSRCYRRY